MPETLLEAELFGYERGAFTSASRRHLGRIEQAYGGTLFLDEISEMDYPLQAKLLRFLQSKELSRLGGTATRTIDVRVVAATSRDLRDLVEDERFQSALYYRLNVVRLRLPPLRERPGDVRILFDHFLDELSQTYARRVRIAPEVYACLEHYPFPGNVRELENVVHQLVALASDEELIGVGALPPEIVEVADTEITLGKDRISRLFKTPARDLAELQRRRDKVRRLFAEDARRLAETAVAEHDGNVSAAARQLGVHRVTLHKMLKGTAEDA